MDTKNYKERFVKIFLSVLIFLSASTFLHSQITISQSQFLELLTPGKLLYANEGTTGLINIGGLNGPNEYDFTSEDLTNLITLYNYEVSQIPALAATISIKCNHIWRWTTKYCKEPHLFFKR